MQTCSEKNEMIKKGKEMRKNGKGLQNVCGPTSED